MWRSARPRIRGGANWSPALGALLIQAARWEEAHGEHARLVLSEGGDPDLAAELVRRTRATVDEDDDWGR